LIPIHELLNRIRWDAQFGRGDFVIGYHDRVTDRMERVPMRDIFFEPGDRFSFHFTDDRGAVHDVPLHRIREVCKDGEVIWQRRP